MYLDNGTLSFVIASARTLYFQYAIAQYLTSRGVRHAWEPITHADHLYDALPLGLVLNFSDFKKVVTDYRDSIVRRGGNAGLFEVYLYLLSVLSSRILVPSLLSPYEIW